MLRWLVFLGSWACLEDESCERLATEKPVRIQIRLRRTEEVLVGEFHLSGIVALACLCFDLGLVSGFIVRMLGY